MAPPAQWGIRELAQGVSPGSRYIPLDRAAHASVGRRIDCLRDGSCACRIEKMFFANSNVNDVFFFVAIPYLVTYSNRIYWNQLINWNRGSFFSGVSVDNIFLWLLRLQNFQLFLCYYMSLGEINRTVSNESLVKDHTRYMTEHQIFFIKDFLLDIGLRRWDVENNIVKGLCSTHGIVRFSVFILQYYFV